MVAALQQLPAMQRKAVLLRHWLDLSVEETARELGVSTGTVKSHTSRGLAALHAALTSDAERSQERTMSNDTLMDPREFAGGSKAASVPSRRTPRSGTTSPGERRRLRRRRAGTTVAALATVGVVSAGGLARDGDSFLPHEAREIAPAGAPRVLTADGDRRHVPAQGERQLDGAGRPPSPVRTRPPSPIPTGCWGTATADDLRPDRRPGRSHTALRGRLDVMGRLPVPRAGGGKGVKSAISIYPTDITFPRLTVAGSDAYEPDDEADPRHEGSAVVSVPEVVSRCVETADESPSCRREARCTEFSIYWNDRRPPEVAAARVTTPDGVASWAGEAGLRLLRLHREDDARDRGAGRPGRRPRRAPGRLLRRGGQRARRRPPPGTPAADGSISIENFPSLAWWRK